MNSYTRIGPKLLYSLPSHLRSRSACTVDASMNKLDIPLQKMTHRRYHVLHQAPLQAETQDTSTCTGKRWKQWHNVKMRALSRNYPKIYRYFDPSLLHTGSPQLPTDTTQNLNNEVLEPENPREVSGIRKRSKLVSGHANTSPQLAIEDSTPSKHSRGSCHCRQDHVVLHCALPESSPAYRPLPNSGGGVLAVNLNCW